MIPLTCQAGAIEALENLPAGLSALLSGPASR